MESEEIQKLKSQLEEEAKELEAQLAAAKRTVDFGNDPDHFEEEADEAEEFANAIDIVATLKQRLGDIGAALDKVNQGGYGICEKCRKEISLELLKIDPESKLCKTCKNMETGS